MLSCNDVFPFLSYVQFDPSSLIKWMSSDMAADSTNYTFIALIPSIFGNMHTSAPPNPSTPPHQKRKSYCVKKLFLFAISILNLN